MASSRVSRLALAACASALVALAPCTAFSAPEPTAQDRETARGLMDEGRTRSDRKDLKGALEAFAAADAIMHVPSTGIAVAKTQLALGLIVEARDTALRVARLPVAASEPPAFAEARKAADELDAALAPRIPTLRVTLKGVPADTAPEVRIDDVAVNAEVLIAPRRLNPGHHVVVAKIGTVERRAEADLAERENKSVTLEFPPGMAPVRTAAPAETKPTEPQGPRGRSPLVYIGIGVGALGLLTGLGAGYFSISKVSSAKENCRDMQCPPSTHDDLDTATTMATVSNIGFIVAGAGAATFVIGLLMSGGRAEAKPAAVRARPFVGAGNVGVVGEF